LFYFAFVYFFYQISGYVEQLAYHAESSIANLKGFGKRKEFDPAEAKRANERTLYLLYLEKLVATYPKFEDGYWRLGKVYKGRYGKNSSHMFFRETSMVERYKYMV
jgi:hypothetical protein